MRPLAKKYLQKAKTAYAQDRLSQAYKHLDAALHIAPEDPKVLRCHIDFLKEKNLFEEAVNCLLQVLEKQPHQPALVLELAELMINRLQQPNRALVWLNRLLHARCLKPKQEQRVHELEAEALLDQERFYEAWLKLRQALRKYPKNIKLLFWYGWSTLQLERYYAAASTFQKVLRLEPEYVDAHYYLGVAYEAMGEYSLMRKQFATTHHLDLLYRPEPCFSRVELAQIATQILREEWRLESPMIGLQLRNYPDSSILDEFPFDPRRMASLERGYSASRKLSEAKDYLVLYLWNIERYCGKIEEVREEIHLLLQQEFDPPGGADFPYSV